ncbi:MAG TPA: pilin [Candidatus Saccharimonadales bacterium]|nr:pilin [Candidatus Saccharimonadales bacterium]
MNKLLFKMVPAVALVAAIGLLIGLAPKTAAATNPNDTYTYGNPGTDCGNDLVVVTTSGRQTASPLQACLALPQEAKWAVSFPAPANGPCPDKTISSFPSGLGKTHGVLVNNPFGGQACIYSVAIVPGRPTINNASGSAASSTSNGCPDTATPGLKLDCTNKNPIYSLLQFIINWAVRLLAVLAVFAIVISGIQYIVSQGNPDGIKSAKTHLVNAIIGLVLLSLMFVILHLLGVT